MKKEDKSSPLDDAEYFSRCHQKFGASDPTRSQRERERVKGICRHFRRDCTDAEQLLWRLLRNCQIAGSKFRRQHPFGPYILDFFCSEARLAIELDGGQHTKTRQAMHDEERTQYLKHEGVCVLRFWNHEALIETEAVLETIWNAITSPHPNPLPEGEGVREQQSELPKEGEPKENFFE
jgi:very-short-patch-repair endonuclease